MVHAAVPDVGFNEADIRALSIHAGGAMALIIVQVYPYTIRLVGRWRSDTMLHYLQMTGKSLMGGQNIKMFKHGTYTIIPPTHSGN